MQLTAPPLAPPLASPFLALTQLACTSLSAFHGLTGLTPAPKRSHKGKFRPTQVPRAQLLASDVAVHPTAPQCPSSRGTLLSAPPLSTIVTSAPLTNAPAGPASPLLVAGSAVAGSVAPGSPGHKGSHRPDAPKEDPVCQPSFQFLRGHSAGNTIAVLWMDPEYGPGCNQSLLTDTSHPSSRQVPLNAALAQRLAGTDTGLDVDQLMVLEWTDPLRNGLFSFPAPETTFARQETLHQLPKEAFEPNYPLATPHGLDQEIPRSAWAIVSIWNRDGSQAKACGNGTRCVIEALLSGLISDQGYPSGEGTTQGHKTPTSGQISVASPTGPLSGWILPQIPDLTWVLQGYGRPGPTLQDPWAERVVGSLDTAPVDPASSHASEHSPHRTCRWAWDSPTGALLASIDLGNPHLVVFWPAARPSASATGLTIGVTPPPPTPQDWDRWYTSSSFPEGVNVSVVRATYPSFTSIGQPCQPLLRSPLEVSVRERGSGWTQACGTAATAVAAALCAAPPPCMISAVCPGTKTSLLGHLWKAQEDLANGQDLTLSMPGGTLWVRHTPQGIAHGAQIHWTGTGRIPLQAFRA